MKEPQQDYHISFFKPTTERARFNRNLVIWLASIWFIAIFGFQIALRVLEKPVPEPPLLDFRSSWTAISNGNYSDDDLQKFGQATLSVLGKIALEPQEREILKKSMTWSIVELYPDSVQANIVKEIADFVKLKSEIDNINDPEYVSDKILLAEKYSPVLGLSDTDARTRILPVELTNQEISSLGETAKQQLPSIMDKYMIHNQSVLTDTVFLGFPFHYFYTAVFLLILFVGLCWLYCIRSDRRNVILGIEE